LTGNLLIALSVLGGIILLIGFWKSIKNDAVDGALSKDRLANVSEEYEKLKNEHLKLLADHQSLHDMKINVSNINPLVESGLFEAELNLLSLLINTLIRISTKSAMRGWLN
jgi:hypothetical protein